MPTHDAPTEELIIARSFRQLLSDMADDSVVAGNLLYAPSVTTAQMNYISFKRGQVTYLPAGRPHVVNDNGQWAQAGRQSGKPARIARKLLRYPESFNDYDYERFADMLVAVTVGESGSFAVVREEGIREAYEESGNVGLGSCMTYDHALDYLQLYVDNPEQIGLLISRDVARRFVGRGLVWTLDCGLTVLDRVYGGAAASRAMRDYAVSQGWGFKASDSWSGAQQFVMDQEEYAPSIPWSDIHVTLPNHKQDSYPYLDTLSAYYPERGVLSAQQLSNHGRAYRLDSTSGEPCGLFSCRSCGRSIIDDETAIHTENGSYCTTCHARYFIPCAGCEEERHRDSLHVMTEEGVESRYCSGCYANRMTYCNGCGAWRPRVDCTPAGYCADCQRLASQRAARFSRVREEQPRR